MLEAEVPAKVVQDVLGHADVTLTLNTYSHVISTTAHEQMAKINDLFEKPSALKRLKDAKEQTKDKEAPSTAKKAKEMGEQER